MTKLVELSRVPTFRVDPKGARIPAYLVIVKDEAGRVFTLEFQTQKPADREISRAYEEALKAAPSPGGRVIGS